MYLTMTEFITSCIPVTPNFENGYRVLKGYGKPGPVCWCPDPFLADFVPGLVPSC